jgi:hypothetical protein
VLKLKWSTCQGLAGIHLHADPTTAATPAGWVGVSMWIGRLHVSADLLSSRTRAEALGITSGTCRRHGPLRVCLGAGARGPNVVARVLADLLTPGPRPESRLAEVLSALPWLELDLDPGARVVRRRWWPAAVAERIRRATEAQLGEPVRLK